MKTAIDQDVRESLRSLAREPEGDDTLATTFEAIACLDCRALGISAIACASRQHHNRHGR